MLLRASWIEFQDLVLLSDPSMKKGRFFGFGLVFFTHAALWMQIPPKRCLALMVVGLKKGITSLIKLHQAIFPILRNPTS